jgi:hypothetical protein
VDTLKFLNKVLATTGLRCIDTPGRKGGMVHHFRPSNIELADKAAALDTNKSEVWVAVATFRDNVTRKAVNAVAARAHHVDLDCGKGKPYADQPEALRALKRFCKAAGLPLPMVVNSGNGIHCWWTHDEDVGAIAWKRMADKLKACCRAYGLEQDPSRTGDIASLMRLPGTHNRKDPKNPKLVTVVAPGSDTSPEDFEAALDAALAAAGVQVEGDGLELPEGGPARSLAGANDDLKAGLEYTKIPSSAYRIAEKCGVVSDFAESKGQCDQPTWYHVLQLLQHTVEAPDICHEWSSGDPRYSEAETDRVLARLAKVGPTTCAKLNDITNGRNCLLCDKRGQITSPIQLGQVEGVEVAPTMVTEAGEEKELELPHGYKWGVYEAGKAPAICHVVVGVDEETGEKVSKWEPITETLFFATQRLKMADGEWATEFEMRLRDGGFRRFTVTTGQIGEGGKALAGTLGKLEIMALPGQKTKMENYLGRWVDHMRETADEVQIRDHFGWVGERQFLLGDQLVTPEGIRQVPLKGGARQLKDAYACKGELDEWKRIVDTAYNYEGQEAYQYLVLLGFAAPLFAMFGQYGGITVHAYSQDSGVGKTTAQRAALSAWGDYAALQMTAKQTTINAMWSRVGIAANLPIMLDELTNQECEQAADMVFSLSSGQTKQRLNSASELKSAPTGWRTILMTSANNRLSEKLTSHRADAEAELARLFEVRLENTSRISPNAALDLFPGLLKNYGHAGLTFITHVVENFEAVEAKLNAVHRDLNERVGATQKERYWSALQASVLTALYYCRKVDIVQFDLRGMQTWILSRVAANRQQLTSNVGDPQELFGRMLNTLWSGVLVTDIVGDMRRYSQDGRQCAAQIVEDMRPGFNELYGRAILNPGSSEEITRPTLFLSAKAAKDWATKNGVGANEIFEWLVRRKAASPTVASFSLGRGTRRFAGTSAPVRCWEIYLDALGEVSPVKRFSVAQ